MFEPSVTPKIDYKNYLMLSIYKNGLIHLFFPECFVACTLLGFKQKVAFGEGVDKDVLWDGASFIAKLLDEEFLLNTKFESRKHFDRVVAFMI